MKKYRISYQNANCCGVFTIKAKSIKSVFKQLSEIFNSDNYEYLNIDIVESKKNKS